MIFCCFRRTCAEYFPCLDDPAVFHGMPVGLQLVGKTLEEEAVLAMTGIVVEALRSGRKARL